ncbi:hypothetical protein DENSPDRAFT_397628 [Dentipellis sp. KUC8613]|nr:hypothetical protein DENSPDRAFT_397628 [Dentipellis sp. KUC8613]
MTRRPNKLDSLLAQQPPSSYRTSEAKLSPRFESCDSPVFSRSRRHPSITVLFASLTIVSLRSLGVFTLRPAAHAYLHRLSLASLSYSMRPPRVSSYPLPSRSMVHIGPSNCTVWIHPTQLLYLSLQGLPPRASLSPHHPADSVLSRTAVCQLPQDACKSSLHTARNSQRQAHPSTQESSWLQCCHSPNTGDHILAVVAI